MITDGVLVGRVVEIRPHPRGDRDRIAIVDLGDGVDWSTQIVFGGRDVVREGSLVPIAPPGAKLPGRKRMRVRRFRGELSHGMFCSLVELGWAERGPDEVAILTEDFEPGRSLDDIDWIKVPSIVMNTPVHDEPIVWDPRVEG